MTARAGLWKVDVGALAVCGLLGGGLYYFGASPLLRARAHDRTQAALVAQRTDEADRLRGSIALAEQRIANVRQQLASTALRLARADQINARVGELTDLAGRHRLEINEIKPGIASREVRYTRVPIRITGAGTFKACALFLHYLRQEFPDTGLLTLEIAGDPSSEEVPLRFAFDLVWYAAPAAQASAEK